MMAACLTIGAAVGLLVRDSTAEFGILLGHHLPMAQWWMGGPRRDVLTYPMWGYPALLTLLPVGWLQVAQVLAGSATLALVWLAARREVTRPRLLLWLLVLAVPWHALCVGWWPMGPASCLALAAAIGLARAHGVRQAALAGLLLGLALQFRSEWLLLPPAVLLVSAATRLGRGAPHLQWGTWATWAVVAVALLGPWALHHRQQTGRLALTSTNGGMVAYVSLGQLPNNPWGIVHDDGYAAAVLKRQGIVAAPWSHTGHQALQRLTVEAITGRPVDYARKVVHNLRNVFLGGLYVGELSTDPADAERLDVLRERVKLLIGLNPNSAEIERYRQTGAWDGPGPSARSLLSLAWQSVGVAVGSIYLLAMVIGLVIVWRTGSPTLLQQVFAALILAQIANVALLQYQPRHVGAVELAGAPFVAEALTLLAARVRSSRVAGAWRQKSQGLGE